VNRTARTKEDVVAADPALEPVSRRDRVRADTVREIKQTARRVLVEEGVDGLALRAVAREMGMTAPGLYRYFDSREHLVEAVVVDLYTELCDGIEADLAALERQTPAEKLMRASRSFRAWATTHRQEFGLLFGAPVDDVPTHDTREAGPAHEAGMRFGRIFGALIAELWFAQPFPVPADDQIDPALRAQLDACAGKFPVPLPLGVVHVYLTCWVRLYGMVCMEVFGHLRFALADVEPMFEAELLALGRLLGIADEYRRP
jgi:AcrR family transcriptional regulator